MTYMAQPSNVQDLASGVDYLDIQLRAYAEPIEYQKPEFPSFQTRTISPSKWTLVFDTETTTDPSQRLRIGSYYLCKGLNVEERGLFYEAKNLSANELATLKKYSTNKQLRLLTRAEFVDEVLLKIGYNLRATIVGFNLPFDISRIAIDHHSARGAMRGGFSFKLTEFPFHPRLQVKHLSSRQALVQFTVPATQSRSRGMRNRGISQGTRRGFFVDVKTLGAALLGETDSLQSLSETLQVETLKSKSNEHGQELSETYLDYAMGDVETTWQCYCKLIDRYNQLGLGQTPPHKIFSEASVGKAYLREMGIQPWQKVQSDFPPELIGKIMSSYFGGRAEVRIRREIRQVIYCDFLSMYPTVCALMNLWSFVAAKGVSWRDSTAETRQFLKTVSIDDLSNKDTWRELRVLVQVKPDNDLFPVRAKYGQENQSTIGLNHLASDQPLWFTLADCIASKLLTGKQPEVVEAISFEPKEPQDDLQPIKIMGNRGYTIDPTKNDFYLRTVDLRSSVKAQVSKSRGGVREAFDRTQQFLKLLANSTSYGVFVEINVEKQDKLIDVHVHGGTSGYVTKSKNLEKPGPFFHPLLATLITGAARLMLAMCQQRVIAKDLEWAFCDTDSMAIAKPDGIDNQDFLNRVNHIVEGFASLNPYQQPGSVLKVEDVNCSATGKTIIPLYCLAVSAKRYALFNKDAKGGPVLRQASGHGLGHLRPPYNEEDAPAIPPKPIWPHPSIGVPQWQHDVWCCIVDSALAGHPDQINLSRLPNMTLPAFSRYAATTPKLLRWFKHYNAKVNSRNEVGPFNFLLAATTSNTLTLGSEIQRSLDCEAPTIRKTSSIRPIAPFTRDTTHAAAKCFDRETGEAVPASLLKSYREVLQHYHIHPETKFLNGEAYDSGTTRPRHIIVRGVRNIGKEANNLDQRFYLGDSQDDDIGYGFSPETRADQLKQIKNAVAEFGIAKLARTAGISSRHLSNIVHGISQVSPILTRKLLNASSQLAVSMANTASENAGLLEQLRCLCERYGVREISLQSGIDHSNLLKFLKCERQLSVSVCGWLSFIRK